MAIPFLKSINVVNVASDPSSPNDGDMWYNTTTHQLMARMGGTNVALGSSSTIGNMDGGASNTVYGGSLTVDGGGA